MINTDEELKSLEKAVQWAKKYPEENLNPNLLEKKRREVKRVKHTLEINCSVAAYGESQVGKSYLISSLLSTPSQPFEISDGERNYSFIDDINSSGGNTSQTESTGIVTRFTAREDRSTPKGRVRITLLSVADLLTMLTDSYYNDLKLEADDRDTGDTPDEEEKIRRLVSSLVDRTKPKQEILTEDDLHSIYEYIRRELGGKAQQVLSSRFPSIIGESIAQIHPERWGELFSFLWHDDPSITRLFDMLVGELRRLGFASVVYVPFRAVLREYGSILKVEWLDYIMAPANMQKPGSSTDEPTTDVYSAEGPLCKGFPKSSLSALIAELTFVLPETIAKERPFLRKLDLLDFPGARTRLQVKGEALKQQDEGGDVIPALLRRGKVAYLFNKYSHALLISGVLFCHHNDQRTEATLGNTIDRWIADNIGKNEEEREKYLSRLDGVSPFFFIGTKFNKELTCTKMDQKARRDPDATTRLNEHWKRFDMVIPELIGPARWLDHWVQPSKENPTGAFRSIYLLRDFYWSGRDRIFVGYSDGTEKSQETGYAQNQEYPGFMEDLRESFLEHPFVRKHFENPSKAWEDVATPCNDGSRAIIEDLNKIADRLDDARRERYGRQLEEIRKSTLTLLEPHFEADDPAERNRKLQLVIGSFRASTMEVGNRPEIFGYTIDRLMIPASLLHRVAYDILILRTVAIPPTNITIFLRHNLGITGSESLDEVRQMVEGYFGADYQNILDKYHVTVEDLASADNELNSTMPKLLTAHLLRRWQNFLSGRVEEVKEYIDQAPEVIDKLMALAKEKDLKSLMEKRIESYLSSIQDREVLPTLIADYASLFLNHFVTMMGSDLINDRDREAIERKAKSCNIMYSPPVAILRADDDDPKEAIIRGLSMYNGADTSQSGAVATILESSFFRQFQLWQRRAIDCIFLTSDASTKNPVANRELGSIITTVKNL